MSHVCLPGSGHTSPLYPRQSLPTSVSSKWSWRCGNSGLQQCRQRSSTGSCTTQWLSYSPALSRTPAPTTRTSRRTALQSARKPSPSGPPQPCLPHPGHQEGFSGASRCLRPRPSPWLTLTLWCRSVALRRAQGRGRGRPPARTPRSTARWLHVPSDRWHTRRTHRGQRHCAEFLRTKTLPGLMPTKK